MPLPIDVGDIVNVYLNNGSVLTQVEVTYQPIRANNQNEQYWAFEATDGTEYVVGPSLRSIVKLP